MFTDFENSKSPNSILIKVFDYWRFESFRPLFVSKAPIFYYHVLGLDGVGLNKTKKYFLKQKVWGAIQTRNIQGAKYHKGIANG